MLGSTIPVSIIGARFAMDIKPFWKPEQYSMLYLSYIAPIYSDSHCTVPIVGMLCGSTISGIVVSVTYVLKEI